MENVWNKAESKSKIDRESCCCCCIIIIIRMQEMGWPPPAPGLGFDQMKRVSLRSNMRIKEFAYICDESYGYSAHMMMMMTMMRIIPYFCFHWRSLSGYGSLLLSPRLRDQLSTSLFDFPGKRGLSSAISINQDKWDWHSPKVGIDDKDKRRSLRFASTYRVEDTSWTRREWPQFGPSHWSQTSSWWWPQLHQLCRVTTSSCAFACTFHF